jgi:hypothetical protein
MNTEYLWWFAILVAFGVGVVAYLALGPVPEIPAASGASAGATAAATDDDQSSPASTTEPGPGEPSSTSETP